MQKPTNIPVPASLGSASLALKYRRGFGSTRMSWIKTCIMTTQLKEFINNEYTTSFKIAAVITMSFILTGIIAAFINF